MNRREWGIAGVAVAAAAVVFSLWWPDLFGPGTWGTGGNMVAWVICGGLAFANVRARDLAHHRERMDQADAHHKEAMEHHAAVRTHLEQHGAKLDALHQQDDA